MRFSVYQVSRRGGREKNEDRMGYCYTRESGLFALADGMGGHPDGEVAAHMALQNVAALYQRDAQPVLPHPTQFLETAVLLAHQQLLAYAAERGMSDTPRTTVVVAVMQQGQIWWAHCGDSRMYLARDTELIARTRDHSYSELQEALGRHATGAERFNRHVLFTCLGSPGKPMIDVNGPVLLQNGDRMLLCSDGLWSSVSDADILRLLSEARTVADAVPELVEQALRQAGARSDNVTALAVEWEGEGDAPDSISTQDLDDQGFASTIQGAGQEQLDEAEIDSAVREIQDAIRRAGKKPR
ncbi:MULTISPECIES: PP2C family protein-serine/threonine phosphatase [Roseateles]|uniref:Protein serine/threonine phosphatase n=2 Tax=Roseateles TaxID=93681 RepID=A0A0U3N1Z3_9BURK|nr:MULTISPECIES: PP2C family serine/threonine-protein phosphatase [Roseateles]ALV08164.1 protein serine/threonine phosphatase [Roseateles depolymerans]MBB3194314.1 serine/threonine protein phosphatase PrpC [Roseateles terrae]OWQ88152.1 serine/threonine protein phosphatase [Roseateles terrae]REG21612.1 serine/threonine protein phosphatase PrpC [Roseateles depolymerans]